MLTFELSLNDGKGQTVEKSTADPFLVEGTASARTWGVSLLEWKVCTLGFTLLKEQKMSSLGRLLLRQRSFTFEHSWIF